MTGFLSTDASAVSPADEVLQYAPPSGSTLVGGSVDVGLYADGYGDNASGTAIVYTPTYSYPGGVYYQCAYGLGACSSTGDPHDYVGTVHLPADRGGDLYVAAGCGGNAGASCSEGGSENAWALVQVFWADLLLSSSASPAASGFGGSLLSPNPTGTADVSFTATEPGGPGIYNVTVKVDATTVYDATPDSNSGECVPVGTDSASGALMFDGQQPCPSSEFVDVPVETAGLSGGPHQLTVTVTDAAQNTSTVVSRTITIAGSGITTTTPPLRHHVATVLSIVSRYTGSRTRLTSIKTHRLPPDAKITVHCQGRHCPRPSTRTATAAHARRLWKALAREVFTAGDRVIFTIAAPNLDPERLEVVIGKDAKPLAKRL